MAEEHFDSDAEIIRAAYAEKVREAFKVFAENVGMGQNQKSSIERFVRSLELVRKARDMALEAASGVQIVEPTAEREVTDEEAAATAQRQKLALDGVSAEDQKMIESVLSGTTGHKPLLRR